MSQIAYSILSIFLAIIILIAAYLLGRIFIHRIKLAEKINQNFHSSLAILLGYGLIILLALVLSFFGPINKFIVYSFLLLILVVNYKELFYLPKRLFLVWENIKKYSVWEKVLLVGIIFCFIFYLTSALVPPYRTDALAYHLPEAISVSEGGLSTVVKKMPGAFFTNLPVSAEVLDASLYAAGGFSPIHLVHYSILLALLFFIFKLIKEYFDNPKALLAILLIFSLYDLFVNGTNAYIDAIMITWELSGFILVLLWAMSNKSSYLGIAGFFFGLSLATKYNALYGILLASLVILFYLIKNKNKISSAIKKILIFTLPILLVAGFWYFKNLIFYGNPIYPFYFGHPGFTGASYLQMITAVKSFIVDRTLINFILFPFIFFFKSYYFVLFLAFMAWPFIFVWKKFNSPQKQIIRILSFYIAIYSFLWFFTITHQPKFFYGPMILLMVIFAVQLDFIKEFILKRVNNKIIIVLVILFLAGLSYKVATAKNNYFINVKKNDLLYVLGFSDKAEFYKNKVMGDVYLVSQYINNNFKNSTWLNIWGATGFFLSNGNKFTYNSDLIYNNSDVSISALLAYLQKNGINKAIIDSDSKDRSANDEFLSQVCRRDPKCYYYRQHDEAIEKIIKDSFASFYYQGQIKLYNLESYK
ncbi:hypothetical protein COT93_00755 [Candidatus Falkowbacteria bacterium CG10_big_fil_rev_8_21_14_0_10_37_18]|uniref:Uncharacterized protein n=1 Tax=Candidatus Falkowbacteria bacterium CG10_big_fil_rev_8_21_14_0_10_37_18 TaxID=1974562 RepID=A0A2H0V9K0_9BACT|nr:hypothetical protein [Candidatus Falkowbacteria bacterium]PIR95755.1 MAG: hypothetical protein COT93_00755 [Candidatus Falkowbacteria bacterium CG10_big_fil_rev_8_21_14_0_10_37_18]